MTPGAAAFQTMRRAPAANRPAARGGARTAQRGAERRSTRPRTVCAGRRKARRARRRFAPARRSAPPRRAAGSGAPASRWTPAARRGGIAGSRGRRAGALVIRGIRGAAARWARRSGAGAMPGTRFAGFRGDSARAERLRCISSYDTGNSSSSRTNLDCGAPFGWTTSSVAL